jgi:hypothetical protein
VQISKCDGRKRGDYGGVRVEREIEIEGSKEIDLVGVGVSLMRVFNKLLNFKCQFLFEFLGSDSVQLIIELN